MLVAQFEVGVGVDQAGDENAGDVLTVIGKVVELAAEVGEWPNGGDAAVVDDECGVVQDRGKVRGEGQDDVGGEKLRGHEGILAEREGDAMGSARA